MSATRRLRLLAVGLAGTVVVTSPACARTGGSSGSASERTTAESAPARADFGALTDVCRPGDASGDTAVGVKGGEIHVGTMTDFGFTQNREFINAAEVFTRWCNDAGGINGRKLAFNVRDTKLFEHRQRVLEACREDFFLVGGGAAFDGAGVRDRLKCLLPEIPAQTVSTENGGADLQIEPLGYNRSIGQYAGYFRWLVKEGFPGSAGAVGIIAGDIGVTKVLAAQYKEHFEGQGAKLVYNNIYPAAGVSDWTPYAQAIKSDGVKGLAFLGDFTQLAKLEQALTDVGYKLDWVDANSNAYNQQFIQLGGTNLDQHANLADAAIFPLEKAADNPATKQLVDIFKKYAPDADVTKPVVNAWSAWLMFAVAARACGAPLTRRCVYDKLTATTEWDGAGLHAPSEPNNRTSRRICFTVEKASSSGWSPAGFAPNQGAYRCENEANDLKGSYGKATTLADVGLSLADLK
jgi:ABC-type branched-subunit amino acid transport system substrate-binding protein